METKSHGRVSGPQQRAPGEMGVGKSDSLPHLNETAQAEPPPPSHSTPLHPVRGGRRKRRKWRKTQVHPITESLPSAVDDSLLNETPLTISLPPSTEHPPLSGSEGHLSPLARLPPDSQLSCSLPPLLSSRLRKGGRRASASTDWSSWGPAELERALPHRQLTVFVCTWNMQQMTTLPDSLDDLLLPASQEVAPELYVVGSQESTAGQREWEVLVQQTLGPSHLLLHVVSLGELYLLLFLRRDLLWFCSKVQSAGYSTRPGSMVKTKGGVGLSFSLFGTSFLFISSHFTAHHDKVEERNTDMQRIAANLTRNGLNEFDCVFWLGDLNYRVDLERGEVDQVISQWRQEGGQWPRDGWMPLLLHDQLTKEILQGHVFQGFSEQPVTFPPSYKFDPQSVTYDSSPRQRVPSWTDRILFRSRTGSGISGCGYNMCHSLRCSDHRPVYGVFRVGLDPCSEADGVPDVMAHFNRDVYRIAQQRRREVASLSLSLREGVDGGAPATHRTTSHVTSSFCSIL